MITNFNSVLDRMFTLSQAMADTSHDAAPSNGNGAAVNPQLQRTTLHRWTPSMDISETETAFVVEADLPGVSAEQVDIQYDQHTLTISGTRGATLQQATTTRALSVERRSGSFARAVRLPEHVDADKIAATFEAGVLTVRVPKTSAALPRKISVVGGTTASPSA